MVRKFTDVFPEELPGMPPDRQFVFRIDIVSGAALIAKASYWLAPPEIQELLSQMQSVTPPNRRNGGNVRGFGDFIL